MSSFPEQLQKMKAAPGFIAALDQSGGSTPNALVAYGIKKDAWSNDDEMFAIVHQMRTRIITSPSFTGARILGAILFENTIDRDIEAQPTAGIVINPATPAAVLEEILQDVEHVLVMTVTPGFGQQHFLNTTLPKIRRVREIIEQINPGCDLEVDGGIDAATAPLVVASGANVLVAGSAVFGEREGVAAAMRRLRTAVD